MPPATPMHPVRRFSLELASLYALVGTLVVAAIAFIPVASVPFLPTKTFVLAIGAILTLALYILARLSRGNVVMPPALMLGALWLPTLAYALSAIFSGANFSRALFGGFQADTLGFMVTASVLGTLTALIVRRADQYRTFFMVAVGLALFFCVVELAILLVGQFAPSLISPSTSIVGTLTDLSAFAGLIVIGSLISLRLLTIQGRLRIALFAMTAVALFVLALFNGRIEWIIVALVSLGLFVEAVMRRSPSHADSDLGDTAVITEADSAPEGGERSLVAPLVVLAISLFFILGGNLTTLLANTFHVTVLDVRPSWQSTLGVGEKVFASSPIFGSGPTTFGSEWLKYRDGSLNQTIFWNVDFVSGIGFVPTSAITTGLLGVLAWLVLFGLALYYGVRLIVLRSVQDPFMRFVTIFSFSAAVYLAVIVVGTNVGVLTIALLFVFLGLFASVLRFAPGKNQWGIIFSKSPRIGFVIVFGLTIVLLLSIVGAYGVVERYIAAVSEVKGEIAYAQGDQAAASANANRSLSLVPTSEAYRLLARSSLAKLSKIANDQSLSASAAQQSFQQELAAGINAALSATRLSPDEYQNWVVLGDLYGSVVPLNVEGSYDNAISAYAKAATLNPTSPLLPYGQAQLEIGAKKADAAKKALTDAITLKQDYTPAIFLLSQLEVATGNLPDALKAAEAAAYFTPNDAGVLFQVGILRAATGNADGAIAALLAAVGVDAKFANAHYFLAALYAKKNDFAKAKSELESIAAISTENATAVAPLLTTLASGKNPFPPNLLSAAPPTL